MSENDTTKHLVKRSLNDRNRPKGRFRNIPEDEIDTSEMPELDAAFWERARIVPPRTRPTVTMRVSPEVKEYFQKQDPKGYTSRMAAVLEAYVHSRSGA